MSLSLPRLLSKAFAWSGDKNTIPDASASPLASFETGWPPITEQPVITGGVPPARADFNGLDNLITTHLVYQNAGGLYPFNATLATDLGGYDKDAVVKLNDGSGAVISLVNANTYDPNTPANIGLYWAPWAGVLAGCGTYALDVGTTNNIVISTLPPSTVNREGMPVSFKVAHVNTAACTLDIGAGPTGLKRNDGGPVQSGDLAPGSIYTAIYDAVTGNYYMTAPLTSQYAPLYAPAVPTGVILDFAGPSASTPDGYLYCNGSEVSRTTYAVLYAVIGDNWGTATGSPTTFKLPDTLGRSSMGDGTGSGLSPRTLGDYVGEEEHQLIVDELPHHTHNTVPLRTNSAVTAIGTPAYVRYAVNADGATGATGGDSAHNTIHPVYVCPKIIKT